MEQVKAHKQRLSGKDIWSMGCDGIKAIATAGYYLWRWMHDKL